MAFDKTAALILHLLQTFNPFTSILADFSTALFDELQLIKENQQKILGLLGSSERKPEEDMVESREAAAIIHLSYDRFMAIHKKYFKDLPQGKKLLFFRKELIAFLNGTLPEKVPLGVTEAEDFRVRRLNKRLDKKLRIAT
jgi:hypothetical protein